MKKLFVMAILAFSTNVYAQVNKTLVFCDYNATPQEDSIFMDMYFDLDAATATHQNIEVGFLNAENTGYPDYLYTTGVLAVLGATETAVVATKDTNTLNFSLPSTTLEVNGSLVAGFLIGMTDGKVDGFDIIASGTFNGKTLTNVVFNCYDPSALNNQPQQQTVR